jgi:serine-type D-Ala-D-Ala carboxypeptidase (penicillin-binding protein 5/6)
MTSRIRRAAAATMCCALVLAVSGGALGPWDRPLVAGASGRVVGVGMSRPGAPAEPLPALLPETTPLPPLQHRPWDIPSIRHQMAASAPVRVTATAAILVDGRSGQVLYGRNDRLIWPPASTTKIMTALVAAQSTPLSTLITISPEVAHFREGSVAGLPEGARISLHDLLYALLLPSGNDVAIAIAEGTAGTVSAFVARMNDEAKRLGCTQTHFADPHGLYMPDHYTTAYDLAIIARAALANPTIAQVVRTKRWVFHPAGYAPRVLYNHNRLLSRYPGADGVKTGYVNEAGLTLVASATHGGHRMIAVVLHSRDMYGDSSRLLSYGFAHFRPATAAVPGERLAVVEVPDANRPVVGTVADGVTVDLSPGETLARRVTVAGDLRLPLRRGERIGEVLVSAGGRLVRVEPLVAADDVDTAQTEFGQFVDWIDQAVGHFLGAAAL